MNKELKKKKSISRLIWENYSDFFIVCGITIGVVASIVGLGAFHYYIWNPLEVLTSGSLIAFIFFALYYFILDVIAGIVLIAAIGTLAKIIVAIFCLPIFNLIALLRFRYLPLDKDEIDKLNLDTIYKYLETVLSVQRRGKFECLFNKSKYAPIPKKLSTDVLKSIVKNYGIEALAAHIDKAKKQKKYEHIWEDVFGLKLTILAMSDNYDTTPHDAYDTLLWIGYKKEKGIDYYSSYFIRINYDFLQADECFVIKR